MKVTAQSISAFAPLLEPADLIDRPGQPGTEGGSGGTEASLESLTRFEGALAWEGGVPRGAVPDRARDAWLAGWDHADNRFYHAEDHWLVCRAA